MHGGALNFTGHPAVDLCITAAGLLTSLGVMWRYLLRPLWRLQKKVNQTLDTTIPRLASIAEAAPTILEIAAELRTNGGASIKDSVDRIDRTVKATADQLQALSDYSHTNNHRIRNDLMLLGGRQELLELRVTDLHETVKEQGDLKELLTRFAPSPPTTSPKETP